MAAEGPPNTSNIGPLIDSPSRAVLPYAKEASDSHRCMAELTRRSSLSIKTRISRTTFVLRWAQKAGLTLGYTVLDKMWEPHAGTVVWRYMDLPRYIDLLQRQALFLSRGDRMQDAWEGSSGLYSKEYWKSFEARDRELMGEEYEVYVAQSAYTRQALLRHTYLNCWHASSVESAAMWDLYGTIGRGIALRTTWGRLVESIKGSLAVVGMKVQYVDYNATVIPTWNTYYPFGFKNESFRHEQEVRLVCADLPMRPYLPSDGCPRPPLEARGDDTDYDNVIDLSLESPFGHHLEIDLQQLTDEVFVAPTAEKWFLDVVEGVTTTYSSTWKVSKSSLAAGPVY